MTNHIGNDNKMVLMPCPFCGGPPQSQPYMADNDDYGNMIQVGVVKCTYCGAEIIAGSGQLAATSRWNTRHTLKPTWRPIDPTDPSTLPGEDDADENDRIDVRRKSGRIMQAKWYEVGHPSETHWAPRIKQTPPKWEG